MKGATLKRNLLLLCAGLGSLIADTGHSLTTLGESIATRAVNALPPEHPAELTNRELDEAMA